MTREEAQALCDILSEAAYTHESSWGGRQPNNRFVNDLILKFPDFNWRVILDRSYDRTCWTLTIDDDDKREHYVAQSTHVCIHCGKTAKELGVEERVEFDPYDRD